MSQTKINSGFIGAGAITANSVLSSGVITADLIATGAVGPTEIATGAVSANTKIGSGAITAVNLATDSISAVHIQGNAVGALELNANSVVGDIASSNGVYTHNTHTFQKTQAGRVESVTVGAANVQLNFANAQNFNLTLGINTHLNLPSNPTVGQAGTIVVKQDGTGSRTLSYAGAWEFPSGTAPTLTTTASAEDRIDYYVVAANAIHAVASLNMG
tara:strand:- start:980 stop:1627 length:648 start_codon:yes stop_codon:yes gene_type:complete